MRVLFLSLSLLAAACAKPVIWDKPGGSQAEFDADAARCQYEVELATAGKLLAAYGPGSKADLMHKCLEARGYVARR